MSRTHNHLCVKHCTIWRGNHTRSTNFCLSRYPPIYQPCPSTANLSIPIAEVIPIASKSIDPFLRRSATEPTPPRNSRVGEENTHTHTRPAPLIATEWLRGSCVALTIYPQKQRARARSPHAATPLRTLEVSDTSSTDLTGWHSPLGWLWHLQ